MATIVVAPALEIRKAGDNYQFVTEFVPGDSPRSNQDIPATLTDLYDFFQEAGLPTWQISPNNPHAYSNLIRTPRGELKLIDPIRRRMVNPEAAARAFAVAGIERWQREGRIDRERAASLEDTLSTPQAKTLLGHMGAHLVLSVALPFPIPGLRSGARFAWTLAFRLKALSALATGRITKQEYRMARSVHSIPVMLIALLPGFGAIAYAVSGTVTRQGLGRLLVDQAAYKMPFGTHHRLGLARITAPRFPKSTVDCPFCRTMLPADLQPVRVGR